jgi:hypothetical protein
MNLKKKIGNIFTSKFVVTGPSSYDKRIYRAAVSQRLRNTHIGNGSMDLVILGLGFRWKNRVNSRPGHFTRAEKSLLSITK